ncbi:MAG: copper homeostasis protein CutC [Oscillospiraceae bacterium]|nr:copper homeostasis protein CutC [Oscillospiraceae bacterium]
MNTPLIEACVDSYASCIAAAKGGADRLELCANLAIGGTTPSLAVFKQVKRDCDVKINVLIRPRFGDFLYTEPEMEEMCEEIKMFRDLGANGVVIGTLTPDGRLDPEKMRRLMDCAGDIDVTLHRAFDMTRDPFEALETAAVLGCKTILTSGQEKDAATGKDTLREIYAKAAGRIDIMAGCGVKKWNIQEIHDHTGIVVFHTTGRKNPLDSGMIYRKSTVFMGLPSLSEYEIWQTDEQEFRDCAQIVHTFTFQEEI